MQEEKRKVNEDRTRERGGKGREWRERKTETHIKKTNGRKKRERRERQMKRNEQRKRGKVKGNGGRRGERGRGR